MGSSMIAFRDLKVIERIIVKLPNGVGRTEPSRGELVQYHTKIILYNLQQYPIFYLNLIPIDRIDATSGSNL